MKVSCRRDLQNKQQCTIPLKVTVSDEHVCKLLFRNLANLNIILIERLFRPIFLCRDLST